LSLRLVNILVLLLPSLDVIVSTTTEEEVLVEGASSLLESSSLVLPPPRGLFGRELTTVLVADIASNRIIIVNAMHGDGDDDDWSARRRL
jgi:hypothetical protein